jgi:hypothetical protein
MNRAATTRRTTLLGVFFCALGLAVPAAAQEIAPVPEALRGAWFSGACAHPEATLALTARAAARIPGDGPARLLRFTAARREGEWLIGTGRGAEAPRIVLRVVREASGEALETAEPSNKVREDRLPGDAPVTRWHRCPAPPANLAILHGEGIAMLGALEALEAACGAGPMTACAEAVVRAGDVSGDGLLGPAEVARMLRGLTWVVAASQDTTANALGLATGAGAIGGLAAARVLVDSLDYDGDGRLSARELAQDRGALAAGGSGDPAGRPLALERVAEAVALLRTLIEGLVAAGATE